MWLENRSQVMQQNDYNEMNFAPLSSSGESGKE